MSFQSGDSVWVHAEHFDNLKDPVEERWSYQFSPDGGKHKIRGRVERYIKSSDRLRVLWDLDGNTTTIPACKVSRDVPFSEPDIVLQAAQGQSAAIQPVSNVGGSTTISITNHRSSIAAAGTTKDEESCKLVITVGRSEEEERDQADEGDAAGDPTSSTTDNATVVGKPADGPAKRKNAQLAAVPKLPTTIEFNKGDCIWVYAEYFDNLKDPVEKRWSYQFSPDGGKHKIRGRVERIIKSSGRLRVLWDLDGNITSIPASKVSRDSIPDDGLDQPGPENQSLSTPLVDSGTTQHDQPSISTEDITINNESDSDEEPVIFRNTLLVDDESADELEGDDVDDGVDDVDDDEEATDDDSAQATPSDAGTARRNREKENDRPVPRRKRAVHSLETALDENNYTPVPVPEKEIKIKGILERKLPQKTVSFTNIPPPSSGRHARQNIVENTPGVLPEFASYKDHEECVRVYLTDEVIEELCDNTNHRIRETFASLSIDKQTDPKRTWQKEICTWELYAYIGLVYLRGLQGKSLDDLENVYAEKFGISLMNATMSRNRFQWITRHLCFEGPDLRRQRADRWNRDKMAAIRPFFDKMQKKFRSVLIPDRYLSIDETLYPMRHKVSFRQYNPNKPAKYGFLFKSLNAVEYPYTYYSHAYCGTPNGVPDEHYVTGNLQYIIYLVDGVREQGTSFNMKGCNISMDRLYTSVDVCRELLKRDITMVGTWNLIRRGVPDELKKAVGKDVPVNSSELWYEYNDDSDLQAHKKNRIVVSSYVVQKSNKKKKHCLIMSTHPHIRGVTKDDGKTKPQIIKLYDYTKGGTDIFDQRMGRYSTKTKCNKWSHVGFYFLLDTIRVNSQTLWSLNNNKKPREVDSYHWGLELVEALVKPAIQMRSRWGLGAYTVACINLFVKPLSSPSTTAATTYDTFGDSRQYCRDCLADCSGEGYQAKRAKLGKVKTICQGCGSPRCNKHLVSLCKGCSI